MIPTQILNLVYVSVYKRQMASTDVRLAEYDPTSCPSEADVPEETGVLRYIVHNDNNCFL